VRHLFVCTNTIASGKPACGQRGEAIARAVQRALLARGEPALVTRCECLGGCFDGPSAIVYPDGVWYGALDEQDADALVRHLIDGVVHTAKQIDPPDVP
jgi:(2Fe-2S) ferredoxin